MLLVNEMKEILLTQTSLSEITVETMEVMPNHIHMLISFKPKYAASNVVKALKGHSAKIFSEIKADKLWGGHLWSHSYYMSTLGNMSKDVIERYIQNQYSE